MSPRRQRGRSRPTIRDVSTLSGVSVGTVSNVINSPEVVAEHTRLRVEEAIAELGYIPTAAARNLKSKRSYLVGYPIYDGGSVSAMGYFFRQLVHWAEVNGLGVRSMAFEPGEHAQAFSRLLDADAVDGFLLSEIVEDDARVRWLLDNDVPFAAFGRAEIDTPYCCVDLDVAAGMRGLVAHVLARQHRRLAFIGWDRQPTNRFRQAGVEEELAEADLTPVATVETSFSVDGGFRAGRELLGEADRPTAIVCAHDVLAAGVIKAATERGIAIGGSEMAVTGFDDTALAKATTPQLTTVRFPLDEVARTVVELFVGRLEDSRAASLTLVQPETIIRGSTTGSDDTGTTTESPGDSAG